ncbi:MAG: hypothetical protein HC880_21385 [Bacteroidia bacterium]|nr:hypothetical protein [Bacteroidia bacterium]
MAEKAPVYQEAVSSETLPTAPHQQWDSGLGNPEGSGQEFSSIRRTVSSHTDSLQKVIREMNREMDFIINYKVIFEEIRRINKDVSDNLPLSTQQKEILLFGLDSLEKQLSKLEKKLSRKAVFYRELVAKAESEIQELRSRIQGGILVETRLALAIGLATLLSLGLFLLFLYLFMRIKRQKAQLIQYTHAIQNQNEEIKHQNEEIIAQRDSLQNSPKVYAFFYRKFTTG